MILPKTKAFSLCVLAVAILMVCAASAYSVESANDITQSPKNHFKISDSNYPKLTTDANGQLNTHNLFFRMMLSLGLVIVLGIAAIYLPKKMLPKFTNLPTKKIKIIETAHLGNRRSLHLIEVGSQKFLIGSANENITKLADIAEANITDID